MAIVFASGEATLTEILATIDDPPTRPALRSILTILETKGHLTHRKKGREFVYQPTEGRDRAASAALKSVLTTFFDGSLGKAVASCFAGDGASPEELEELQKLVDEARKKQEGTKL